MVVKKAVSGKVNDNKECYEEYKMLEALYGGYNNPNWPIIEQ
jgi:hypothetical protein